MTDFMPENSSDNARMAADMVNAGLLESRVVNGERQYRATALGESLDPDATIRHMQEWERPYGTHNWADVADDDDDDEGWETIASIDDEGIHLP